MTALHWIDEPAGASRQGYGKKKHTAGLTETGGRLGLYLQDQERLEFLSLIEGRGWGGGVSSLS